MAWEVAQGILIAVAILVAIPFIIMGAVRGGTALFSSLVHRKTAIHATLNAGLAVAKAGSAVAALVAIGGPIVLAIGIYAADPDDAAKVWRYQFQRGNDLASVGRALAQPGMSRTDPRFDPWANIRGYEDFAASFMDANSPEDVARIKARIDQEWYEDYVISNIPTYRQGMALFASIALFAAKLAGLPGVFGLLFGLLSRSVIIAAIGGICAGITGTIVLASTRLTGAPLDSWIMAILAGLIAALTGRVIRGRKLRKAIETPAAPGM